MSIWPSLQRTNDEPEDPPLSLSPDQAARLLDALGTLRQRRTLAAPRALLREAALVAIDELGETLSRHCTSLLRAHGGPTAEVRDALAELGAFLDLFERLDYSAGR